MKTSVQEIFSELIRKGVISKHSVLGCSADEILSVEEHFNCSLPAAYLDFLIIAGRSAGKLFRGTDIFYPRLKQLQTEAIALMTELDCQRFLPQDAKVFCMHQGYEINYFLPASDDPQVYQFFEGQIGILSPRGSFSEFLKNSIENHFIHWSNLI